MATIGGYELSHRCTLMAIWHIGLIKNWLTSIWPKETLSFDHIPPVNLARRCLFDVKTLKFSISKTTKFSVIFKKFFFRELLSTVKFRTRCFFLTRCLSLILSIFNSTKCFFRWPVCRSLSLLSSLTQTSFSCYFINNWLQITNNDQCRLNGKSCQICLTDFNIFVKLYFRSTDILLTLPLY